MSWQIEITHRSGYRYGGDVWASYNEARMTPANTERQRVMSTRFGVNPNCTTHRYMDYFGTVVETFDLHNIHRELEVTSTSLVETSPAPRHDEGCPWETLALNDVTDRFDEYLGATNYTASDPEILSMAKQFLTLGTPHEAVRETVAWAKGRLVYQSGVTGVTTAAREALAQGKGVCQDFAHLTIAVLRDMGIPTRYVSGYLHPTPDGELAQTVEGQSHAWIEAWTGSWRAFDPTNGSAVGERHVVVGRGRDYADVAPLKGVYQGGESEALRVHVSLTRVA